MHTPTEKTDTSSRNLNVRLLERARAEKLHQYGALSGMEHVENRIDSLVSTIQKLHATKDEAYAQELRSSFATSPTPAPAAIAREIRLQAIDSLEQSLRQTIPHLLPYLGTISSLLATSSDESGVYHARTTAAMGLIAEIDASRENVLARTQALLAHAKELRKHLAESKDRLSPRALKSIVQKYLSSLDTKTSAFSPSRPLPDSLMYS